MEEFVELKKFIEKNKKNIEASKKWFLYTMGWEEHFEIDGFEIEMGVSYWTGTFYMYIEKGNKYCHIVDDKKTYYNHSRYSWEQL